MLLIIDMDSVPITVTIIVPISLKARRIVHENDVLLRIFYGTIMSLQYPDRGGRNGGFSVRILTYHQIFTKIIRKIGIRLL